MTTGAETPFRKFVCLRGWRGGMYQVEGRLQERPKRVYVPTGMRQDGRARAGGRGVRSRAGRGALWASRAEGAAMVPVVAGWVTDGRQRG